MTTIPAVFEPTTSSGRVVTADGRELPLRATRLVVRAEGGLATVRLLQTFANPFAEPLQVTYQLPLPADAAVAGFCFRIGDRTVRGEIDRRQAARDRFERAIAEGRTAGLVEQDRTALFTQELGNLPPGAELQAELELDQPLAWVDEAWEWRFPTTVAPRYLGASGRVPDAERIAVDVVDPAGTPLPPRCELDLVVTDALAETLAGVGGPISPSHRLQVAAAAGGTSVCFGEPGGRVMMDRDVVVRWPAAAPRVGVVLQAARSGHEELAGAAFGLLTLVPPVAALAAPRMPRDVIVLLDVSGSMQGAPLDQSQRITAELIGALGAGDRLEMIAFATNQQAWSAEPRVANATNKTAALQWLRGLRASGGTEMHDAILRALVGLRADAQRQVVLVTDGQIGFEREILGTLRSQLPPHSRLHVVGVGSAPNRSLTHGAARAGRGVEVLVGIDEDPAPMVRRLLARTTAPLVCELELSGTALVAASPRALPDLFAGAPARIAVQLRPEGGMLRIRGTGANGLFEHELAVGPVAGGTAAIARWFAREAVEDFEVELAATGDRQRIDAAIEQLGLAHRISTRCTSWVAIDCEVSVDPQAPLRTVRVPHELPHGMAIEALGLRAGLAMPRPMAMPMAAAEGATMLSAPGVSGNLHRDEAKALGVPPSSSLPGQPPRAKKSLLGRLFGRGEESRNDAAVPPTPPAPAPSGAAPSARLATLRLRTAAEWVFELLGCHAWDLPDQVVLVFDDGREVVLAIDVTRTTATGNFAIGTVIRLVLHAVPGLPAIAPVRLRLRVGAQTYEVPIA